jgi:hypothetical protein
MKTDLTTNENERDERTSPLAFMGAAPILSGFSPSFYRHANRQRLYVVVAFFLVFSLLLAGVHTLRVGYELRDARQDVAEAFETGDIPEITLQNGTVTVAGPEPYIAVDDGRSLIVVDTTGQYTGSELRNYDSGVIVTRDTIYSLDDAGRLEVTRLASIQQWLPEKFTINARLGQFFLNLVEGTAFVGLIIWHAVIRPLYITLLALGVWAVAALVRRETSYKAVLMTGLLATVPTLYVDYLFSRIDASFFGMFTLILLVLWAFGLVAAVGYRRSGHWLRGVRSLRPWRAAIGLPMLVVLALDVIYRWPDGATILWSTAGVTAVILIAVSYQTGLGREDAAEGKIAPQA